LQETSRFTELADKSAMGTIISAQEGRDMNEMMIQQLHRLPQDVQTGD